MDEIVSGRNVWARLTSEMRRSSGTRRAAISYTSAAAQRLLPLRRGDEIIVNASRRTLRAGVTDPAVLRHWLDRGVLVHSHDALHAKVFVADDLAVVGSANASEYSTSYSNEALQLSQARTVIRALHSYIDQLKQEATQVDATFLDLAETQYRAPTGGPRLPGVDADGPPPGLLPDGPWTIRYVDGKWHEPTARELEMIEELAVDFSADSAGYQLNTYRTKRTEVSRWQPGDLIIQNLIEEDETCVYPPEVFLGARNVPRTSLAWAFVKHDPSLLPVKLNDLNERLSSEGVNRLGTAVTIAEQRRVRAVLAAFGLP